MGAALAKGKWRAKSKKEKRMEWGWLKLSCDGLNARKSPKGEGAAR